MTAGKLSSTMCTAYEVGWKDREKNPNHVHPTDVARLLGEERRIVRPTKSAPVLMQDGAIRTMLWGFRLPIPGQPGKTRIVYNSREDKLHISTWKKSFAERRCLVPAAAFYEWIDLRGLKVPLRFTRPDSHPTWIAGIWRREIDRGECFSIITTEPNNVMAAVHDRMPALLTDRQIPAYLSGELYSFGPTRVPLVYCQVESFLKKTDDSGPQSQQLGLQ